jgi:hypothetical protein
MPVLVLMYIMNYMDRTSVTQARLYGIQEELGITGPLWQLGISILSVPYICESTSHPRIPAKSVLIMVSISNSWSDAYREDQAFYSPCKCHLESLRLQERQLTGRLLSQPS